MENLKMTYGECHIAEQHSMILKNGQFIKTVHISSKPEPLCRIAKNGKSEAGQCYTNKLKNYWAEQVQVPKTFRGRKLKDGAEKKVALAYVDLMINH